MYREDVRRCITKFFGVNIHVVSPVYMREVVMFTHNDKFYEVDSVTALWFALKKSTVVKEPLSNVILMHHSSTSIMYNATRALYDGSIPVFVRTPCGVFDGFPTVWNRWMNTKQLDELSYLDKYCVYEDFLEIFLNNIRPFIPKLSRVYNTVTGDHLESLS